MHALPTNLLGVSGEQQNILYWDYIRVVFPDYLLSTSKLVKPVKLQA